MAQSPHMATRGKMLMTTPMEERMVRVETQQISTSEAFRSHLTEFTAYSRENTAALDRLATECRTGTDVLRREIEALSKTDWRVWLMAASLGLGLVVGACSLLSFVGGLAYYSLANQMKLADDQSLRDREELKNRVDKLQDRVAAYINAQHGKAVPRSLE